LDGTSVIPERWWDVALRRILKRNLPAPGDWSKSFFEHQLVNSLSHDGAMPCYVPAATFATVVMHLVELTSTTGSPLPAAANTGNYGSALSGLDSFDAICSKINAIQDPRIKSVLLALLEEARADLTAGVSAVAKFRTRIESWFNNTMDRVTGWYIRRNKWFLLLLSLVISVVLNVDTVAICRTLSRDAALRAALVNTAARYVEQENAAKSNRVVAPGSSAGQEPDLQERVESVNYAVGRLNSLGVPLGWSYDRPQKGRVHIFRDDNLYDILEFQDAWRSITKFAGLLLTAFAGSLGAPFWFDLLNKVMQIRGAGKSPEEKAKAT
jgi:hypothetical protein